MIIKLMWKAQIWRKQIVGFLMMIIINSVDDLTACEQKVTIMAVQRELTWATSHYRDIFIWYIFTSYFYTSIVYKSYILHHHIFVFYIDYVMFINTVVWRSVLMFFFLLKFPCSFNKFFSSWSFHKCNKESDKLKHTLLTLHIS